jgi:hypothetical protein
MKLLRLFHGTLNRDGKLRETGKLGGYLQTGPFPVAGEEPDPGPFAKRKCQLNIKTTEKCRQEFFAIAKEENMGSAELFEDMVRERAQELKSERLKEEGRP